VYRVSGIPVISIFGMEADYIGTQNPNQPRLVLLFVMTLGYMLP